MAKWQISKRGTGLSNFFPFSLAINRVSCLIGKISRNHSGLLNSIPKSGFLSAITFS